VKNIASIGLKMIIIKINKNPHVNATKLLKKREAQFGFYSAERVKLTFKTYVQYYHPPGRLFSRATKLAKYSS